MNKLIKLLLFSLYIWSVFVRLHIAKRTLVYVKSEDGPNKGNGNELTSSSRNGSVLI